MEKLNIYHRAMNLRAARLACRTSRREHDYHPLIVAFQWLPVERRIEYKLATSWYNVITCTAPPYLSNPPLLYTPSRTLRSLADFFTPLSILIRSKKFPGRRIFSFIGASIWKTLPFSAPLAQTVSAFKPQGSFVLCLLLRTPPTVSSLPGVNRCLYCKRVCVVFAHELLCVCVWVGGWVWVWVWGWGGCVWVWVCV